MPENTAQIDHRLYAAYLNEHLLASEAGVKAFAAAADTWEGTEHRSAFLSLARQIDADKRDLLSMMLRLGYRPHPVKKLLTAAANTLGRLNPVNIFRSKKGGMTQLELDVLVGMVRTKQMMWETLQLVADVDERLDRAFIADLERRAEDQIRQIREVNAETCVRRFRPPAGDR